MSQAAEAQSDVSELVRSVFQRLHDIGRWKDVEPTRDAMMRECRLKGMSNADAQAWTYSELERLYLQQQPIVTSIGDVQTGEGINSASAAVGDDVDNARARAREGLGGIPDDWPELPANATLAAEIAWVQSNRLYVVEERPGGTVVRLERAHEPAPSRAALGWLETSIRSYAKYVEVAAKATAEQQDEAGHVRRERMAIEEIRELLGEMMENK